MDFSKFSDDNFETKEWINQALDVSKETSIDAHTSNLVMKLQLFIQEVSKSLEETSQIAVNNIPRVLREVETIKTETSLLKNQMTMVKDDIRKVEESTAHSMRRLVEVDQVKSRMQGASSALQEADNWSTLSSEVNKYFEDGDIEQIAEKLIGMKRSLQVLHDVPDYIERQRLLESLKNRLEALLSTKLVQTFNNHDLDEAKYYVNIFMELDRLSQLQTYYNNCHKASLVRTWSEIRDDPNESILQWLPTYFDHLLALWHREVTWCGQVFPDPISALCNLLTQSIKVLNPSIETCIKEALGNEEKPLQLLIQLQNVTSRFVIGLQRAVQSFQSSFSSQGEISPAVELISIVQTPYFSYLLQYSTLQQTSLMKLVESIQIDTHELSETAEALGDSISHVFAAADEAIDVCVQFTQGYGVVGLHESLQVFFSAYFGFLDSTLLSVRKTYYLDVDVIKDNQISTDDQWSHFQHAFKIIEICGTLIDRTTTYREQLTLVVKDMLDKLLNVSSTDENQVLIENYLKLSRPMEWDQVVELHQKITNGSTSMMLPSAHDNVMKLNEHAHKLAFDIIFIHLKRQLASLPRLQIWCEVEQEALDGALPTFSLSPLPYITHVGDSLLTLPQQLEQFFCQDNKSLMTALQNGSIPYQDEQGSQSAVYDHHWLESFARGAVSVYTESILKISLLTSHAKRQLLSDLDYFFNILAALEVQSSDNLVAIKELLDVDAKSFHDKCEEIKVDTSIMKSIAKMRQIR